MLASRLGREAEVPPPPRHVLLLRVQAFIEERLGDPALSPGMIAAANHISLRYLHKLFEPQSRTVAGFIRERRLERCRRDLADPASPTSPCGPSRCAGGSRTRPGSIGCSRMNMVSRPASIGGCASEDNDEVELPPVDRTWWSWSGAHGGLLAALLLRHAWRHAPELRPRPCTRLSWSRPTPDRCAP
jgi:AraC-like DNA-binding protein